MQSLPYRAAVAEDFVRSVRPGLACHSVGAADLYTHPYFEDYPWDSVIIYEFLREILQKS